MCDWLGREFSFINHLTGDRICRLDGSAAQFVAERVPARMGISDFLANYR